MSITTPRTAAHSVHSATLADVLERILDKGLVIAGDIKIKLVDIELLTSRFAWSSPRSTKAREMGLDWWNGNRDFCSRLASEPRAPGPNITTAGPDHPGRKPVRASVPSGPRHPARAAVRPRMPPAP